MKYIEQVWLGIFAMVCLFGCAGRSVSPGEVSVNLQDVTQAREAARASVHRVKTADSKREFDSLVGDLAEADEEYVELAKKAEKDPLGAQEDGRELLVDYRQLTVRALKLEKLVTPRRTLALAKKLDADKYAPKSLAFAEKTIDTAEKLIENNPENQLEIDAKSDEAVFFSQRALALTQHSRKLREESPEDAVLWIENHLNNLTTSLGEKDQRNLSLDEQFETMAGNLKTVASTQKGLNRESDALRTNLASLKDELDKNRPTVDLDQRVSKARGGFAKGEADVMREGQRVLIRLKAMRFASGKSTLEKGNLAVLKKVQDTLTLFPKSDITVEGHTDAVGSPENNQKLSADRAEVVREYLVTQGVPSEQIRAVGRGFEAPIASNKTKEGRALNRRIDVIIEPAAPAAAPEETPQVSE